MVREADQHLPRAVAAEQRVARAQQRAVRDVVEDHVGEDDHVEAAGATAGAGGGGGGSVGGGGCGQASPCEKRGRVVPPLVAFRENDACAGTIAALRIQGGVWYVGTKVGAEHFDEGRVRIVSCNGDCCPVQRGDDSGETGAGTKLQQRAATTYFGVVVEEFSKAASRIPQEVAP